MKKLLALTLAIFTITSCLTACGSKTETDDPTAVENVTNVTQAASQTAKGTQTENSDVTFIELGRSGLSLTSLHKYIKGDISTEDTDENQVAYYYSEDSLVDFDVYEWNKATDETLIQAIKEEANEFKAEVKETEINGIKAAYYYATEKSEGKDYKTVTYIFDNGPEFVEIVFWLDGENAEDDVQLLLASLSKAQISETPVVENEIDLGVSGLSLTPDKKFVMGEISTEDTDENQVAYYKSDETLVDFDVYEWSKATNETLDSAIAEEAKEFNAEVKTKEINGYKTAYYLAIEESEGKEYNTITYMIDIGDEFVEIVFWLDGTNAQSEVDAIMATLN